MLLLVHKAFPNGLFNRRVRDHNIVPRLRIRPRRCVPRRLQNHFEMLPRHVVSSKRAIRHATAYNLHQRSVPISLIKSSSIQRSLAHGTLLSLTRKAQLPLPQSPSITRPIPQPLQNRRCSRRGHLRRVLPYQDPVGAQHAAPAAAPPSINDRPRLFVNSEGIHPESFREG